MATDGTILGGRARDEERSALAREWRKLGRAATVVAVLTSPVTFTAFYVGRTGRWAGRCWPTFIFVIAFRGGVDVLAHKLIPRASLYGAGRELLDEDIIARRRVWYWRHKYRVLFVLLLVAAFALITMAIFGISVNDVGDFIVSALPLILILGIQIPILFLANFLILFGPLLVFGLKQMKGYEPGDADWGVRLSDVRGQKEPKQEVTRVISLWQSGDEFRQAGGKPERGLLFIGAPGTGKTMLSKGIATSFNSPIITMPGSGFAQTFIGMDVVIVMLLIRKARKLARKWGGQCMIFIDEIDAVGMRRQSLGTRMGMGGPGFEPTTSAFDAPPLYGPWGALNPSGDLILENRAWRDRMFAARAEEPAALYPAFVGRVRDRVQRLHVPGMGGWAVAWRSTSCSCRWTASTSRRSSARCSRSASTPSSTPRTSSPSASGSCGCASARPSRARSRSTSSARRTCPSTRWTRRSSARAAWAATSGSARRRRTTARTSSSCTSGRSPTSPTSTRPSAATSCRG
jgi:hypothetical protein